MSGVDNLKGIIVKGVAGFYYVKSGDAVYRCKARGIFKQRNIKPAVGDKVEVEIISGNDDSLITEVLPRSNSFIRPFVANVDCFAVVTAISHPSPVFDIINKLMIMAEKNNADCILCINKCDLAYNTTSKTGKRAFDAMNELKEVYSDLYPIVCMDNVTKQGTEEFKELIRGKAVALAGASGVGKSTILNSLISDAAAETGEISQKSMRGRHTTRHAELFSIDEQGTMIFDTPGFTSFNISEIDEDELQHYFPEINRYTGQCKYNDCRHLAEPGCRVAEAIDEKKIHIKRYESYRSIIQEIKKNKQY